MTPEFIPGLDLARLYYAEAVGPVLRSAFPDLNHSAGLIGPGSEVLGFDTEMSADHNWGARLTIFLSDHDCEELGDQLWDALAHQLPFTVHGYPTHFEDVPDETGTVVPKQRESHPINHRVHITTLRAFVRDYIGVEPAQDLTVRDWLTIPEQKLRALVTGAVYHDGLNVLGPMRQRLAYYPRDIWLYLLSAGWQRIGQEEAFVGRTGIEGDEIGSAIIGARLVRDVMRLCFLMERQYAPYSKWYGTAFNQLECARHLTPILRQALGSASWQEREKHLCAAYEAVATMHNGLGITEPIPTQVSQFHARPFLVIQGESIAERIWESIRDPEVQALPWGIGKVDQFVDSTDVLTGTAHCRKLSALYFEE